MNAPILTRAPALERDPLWYKDAIIYQLHVKSFADSNGDGIGDFPGLISKLDYIAELGANTIWLLPFYPSPRLDDGYDIAEYRAIHPDYGTMADAKRFIAAAHARGLRVITELVINHTSDRHPWFQRAPRQARLRPSRLLCLVRQRPALFRHPHHLHRHRAFELDLGSGGGRLLLAPLLLAPAGPQLRQSPGRQGGAGGDALLARSRRRRPAPGRGTLPDRAGRHEQREPARDARHAAPLPGRARRPLSGPHAAGRGQPVAGGHQGLFRRRRRMPHGVPLPADAAHVHGAGAGGSLPDHRHPAPDAGNPRQLPVGDLPAQP